jgi:hypothetical protein
MDTHAVAAVLTRPLSGNSLEVAHNFNNYAGKGMPSARGSAVTGVHLSALCRGLQAGVGRAQHPAKAVAIEAVRGLFPDTFKTQKNVDAVNNIWRQYRNGVISAGDARSKILNFEGGIRPPDWHGR